MKPGADGAVVVAAIDTGVLGKCFLASVCWVGLDVNESSRQMLPHQCVLNLAFQASN